MADQTPTLHEPDDIATAVARVADGAIPVMGGAEVAKDRSSGKLRAASFVSLNRIPALDTLYANPKVGLHIGAGVRAAQLLPDIWTGKRFAAIHEAVEQLDLPHVGNSATVIGNLCAARADHDMATALMALEAVLDIQGPKGTRQIDLAVFYPASGGTTLNRGEIVTGLRCPGPGTDAGSAFKKLDRVPRGLAAARRINVAATVTYGVEREFILGATLVLGGLALPQRLRKAEKIPLGKLAAPELWDEIARHAIEEAQIPTDPVLRAQVFALIRDTLAQANARALARHDHFDDVDDLLEEQP